MTTEIIIRHNAHIVCGSQRLLELVERLTKLLGLLRETEAKAQGKPPGNPGIPG
jgi:hypothetical protein